MTTDDSRRDITLVDWVSRKAPDMSVMTASDPQPVLQRFNVMAVTGTVEAARAIVLEWERIESHDGAVGFVALGTPPDRRTDPEPPGTDPERVVRHAVGTANRGLIPGMLIGAVLVTLLVWVFGGSSGVLIGAAFGGAALGAVAGAFFGFASGTGWGAAYKDTFVEPGQTEVAVASIHSDAQDTIAEAVAVATDLDGVRLYGLDRTGDPVDLHSR